MRLHHPFIRHSLTALCGLVMAVQAGAFELNSKDIQASKPMPKAQEYRGFGCDGGNRSPQLSWRDAPAGSKSFALTAYDPDAPTGSGWWHWIVYNIPAEAHSLPGNAGDPAAKLMPAVASQHRNDYGSNGFGGACPPKGDKAHRYQFTLYALDVDHLEIAPQSSAALVGFMINSHKLGEARLEALYQR